MMHLWLILTSVFFSILAYLLFGGTNLRYFSIPNNLHTPNFLAAN